jgi:hypothetical protein
MAIMKIEILIETEQQHRPSSKGLEALLGPAPSSSLSKPTATKLPPASEWRSTAKAQAQHGGGGGVTDAPVAALTSPRIRLGGVPPLPIAPALKSAATAPDLNRLRQPVIGQAITPSRRMIQHQVVSAAASDFTLTPARASVSASAAPPVPPSGPASLMPHGPTDASARLRRRRSSDATRMEIESLNHSYPSSPSWFVLSLACMCVIVHCVSHV